MKKIPFEIIEQMIQCFGKCFHYKDPVASFMRHSDVPATIINRHRDLAKFIWARKVLEDLSNSENGIMIQQKLLTNLCNLKDLPDKDVPDRNAGLDALRNLKKLAQENSLLIKQEEQNKNIIKDLAKQKQLLILERAEKLEKLKKFYIECSIQENRQKAGFALEDILKELFELNELDYKKSYKNQDATQQIDGHFKLDSFDYLVEAKWTKDKSSSPEISTFLYKIETKIDSTRGLFISINGFREEVITGFRSRGSKIIFMDGIDLMLILEGRISLIDALRLKVEKAAQIGNPYFSINRLNGIL